MSYIDRLSKLLFSFCWNLSSARLYKSSICYFISLSIKPVDFVACFFTYSSKFNLWERETYVRRDCQFLTFCVSPLIFFFRRHRYVNALSFRSSLCRGNVEGTERYVLWVFHKAGKCRYFIEDNLTHIKRGHNYIHIVTIWICDNIVHKSFDITLFR